MITELARTIAYFENEAEEAADPERVRHMSCAILVLNFFLDNPLMAAQTPALAKDLAESMRKTVGG
jgi:hypothetical protein